MEPLSPFIESPLYAALYWPALCGCVIWPAVAAGRRRRRSRHISALAASLSLFAQAARQSRRLQPLEDSVQLQLSRSGLADVVVLRLAQDLYQDPQAVAEVAQRLATRLRRHVAFERKMLARTASGLRRGAALACLPLLLLWAMPEISATVRVSLALIEALGCVLLWRLARVEI